MVKTIVRRGEYMSAASHGRLAVLGRREEIFISPEAPTSSFRLIPPAFGEVMVTSYGSTVDHEDCLAKGFAEEARDGNITHFWMEESCSMNRTLAPAIHADATHFSVGLDTARYGHHATFLDESRQMAAAPLAFAESREGYDQLRRVLARLADRHGRVHFYFRVDAAGQYAMNLESFLRTLPWDKTISIGEPKRNKDYKNVHFPKRKADAVDSHACARFAIVERPAATPATPAEFQQLRELAGFMESQTKRTTRLINQLHNRLSRVFPELAVLAKDLSAAWVLKLLRKYPTAARIAAARRDSLLALPHVSAERAEKLQHAARRTTGSLSGPLMEACIRSLVDEILASQRAEKRLEKLLVEAFAALPHHGQQQLLTIPGIGPKTAAALAAKIVSIDRFPTPDAVVSYFGAFPEENTSGVDKRGRPVPVGAMRMSAKGNDLVRGLLYMACQSAIQCNPVIRDLYARQRAAGKRGDVALGHCMRKMLHLAFALWKTNQPFDPEYERRAAQLPEQTSGAAPLPAATPETITKKAPGRKEQSSDQQAVTEADSNVAPHTAPVKQVSPAPFSPAVVWIDFAELRAQVSMEAALRALNWLDVLRGSGPQRRGPCPIHGEHDSRSRSFSVNLQKDAFQCFHPPCAAAGNVLDLWAAVHQLPLREAALHLAETFQLTFTSNREEEPVLPKLRSTSP